jgi:hypothetical protein
MPPATAFSRLRSQEAGAGLIKGLFWLDPMKIAHQPLKGKQAAFLAAKIRKRHLMAKELFFLPGLDIEAL